MKNTLLLKYKELTRDINRIKTKDKDKISYQNKETKFFLMKEIYLSLFVSTLSLSISIGLFVYFDYKIIDASVFLFLSNILSFIVVIISTSNISNPSKNLEYKNLKSRKEKESLFNNNLLFLLLLSVFSNILTFVAALFSFLFFNKINKKLDFNENSVLSFEKSKKKIKELEKMRNFCQKEIENSPPALRELMSYKNDDDLFHLKSSIANSLNKRTVNEIIFSRIIEVEEKTITTS